MTDNLTKNELATTGLSPWAMVERIAKRDAARYAVYKKGDWLMGDDDVTGKTFQADPMEIYYGYQRWENATPGEVQMARIDQLHLAPRRADLGDLDKDRWETDANGNPKDPWAPTVKMALIDPETKDLVFFTSSSRGGRDAVNEFCSAYEKDRHRFPEQVPTVRLDSESYKHKTFGKVMKPKFTIVDWAMADGSTPPPRDVRKQIADELNDALPDFA